MDGDLSDPSPTPENDFDTPRTSVLHVDLVVKTLHFCQIVRGLFNTGLIFSPSGLLVWRSLHTVQAQEEENWEVVENYVRGDSNAVVATYFRHHT